MDGVTIEEFGQDLDNQLYKLWNRMSSGSYFPPPVKRAWLPKVTGGRRPLGIPTVADRVAQTVVKMYLEPALERCFHPDSHGYRPGKSAYGALAKARQRCFSYGWVLDLDIEGFFDSIDHQLMMGFVRRYTGERWVLLYIERWLHAPVVHEDGRREQRDRGTPQGGVISPLLANLFLHHVFDRWMRGTFPAIPFERYADDIICHSKTEAQALMLREQVERRLRAYGLKVNSGKTQVVYCKNDRRPGGYPNMKFDFLGYTFRPRRAKNQRGDTFVGFLPAVSAKAVKALRQKLRKLGLPRKTHLSLEALAELINPVMRGWIDYFSGFYRSALYAVFDWLNLTIARWARRKFKRLRGSMRRAFDWLRGVRSREPGLFVHWVALGATAGR